MGKRRPKQPPRRPTVLEEEMSTVPKQQTIELGDLDLPQLVEVKKQLDEELSHLTASFGKLKQAQSRFQDCIDSLQNVKARATGSEILVPLTGSLYVPGELLETDKVIVDVGTGYYVEKTSDDAVKFYSDKVEFVKKNLDKLQETINTKQNNLRLTVDVMQLKISLGAASTSK
ncbi:Prefoldin subunit-domain-containing protein [Gigaspora rosea]|uniref:Prefoldin subunit-domain-containing protein n=1 Tax=Gigaspora rosea TaxID=44941 RepID=A0A397UJK0_9GLOM|nr:Prefoldin subunit-domain-containing protein [Gigaspora rosea]